MFRRMSRGARHVLGAVLLVAFALTLYGVAQAAVVRNVVVSKATGQWVKVAVHTDGPVNYRIKELPPGAYDYRQVVMDVWPASIVAGKEPKAVLPVNEGLVAQVRVRQLKGGVVRIVADVVYWPEYQVVREGGETGLLFWAHKQRGTK